MAILEDTETCVLGQYSEPTGILVDMVYAGGVAMRRGSELSRLGYEIARETMEDEREVKLQGANDSGSRPDMKAREAFQALLRQVDAAQVEMQNGRPAAYQALWSRADDVTLTGGFGGAIEQGWEHVSRRLDWVATQFAQGSNTIERLVAYESGDLGYVVQLEHIRFHALGQVEEARRDFRVTMVFRREADGWRIVHRHADPYTVKQPTH